MDSEPKPASDAALAVAYQVTARWLTNEQQLIWRRTALFITLNSLVVAAVQFLPPMHAAFRVLVPLVGLVYSVCWHYSMNRAWAYQTFLTRMLREQESALNLGATGAFTRALRVMQGGTGESVGGESTRIPPSHTIFRAKLLADATTWLFVIVYALFLLYGASQFKAG